MNARPVTPGIGRRLGIAAAILAIGPMIVIVAFLAGGTEERAARSKAWTVARKVQSFAVFLAPEERR